MSTMAPPEERSRAEPTQAVAAGRRRLRDGLLRRRSAKAGGLVVAAAALLVVALCSLAYGSKPMSLATVLDAFFAYDGSNDHVIVRELRVPRTIVGLGVGVALGLAGAVMQGVTRNPLADPGIFGLEPGAGLAVVIGIHSFGVTSLTGYVWFAFAGAAAAGVAVYGLGSLGTGGATPVKLALAGASVAALFSSLTWGVLLLDIATLDRFRFWVVGSLAGRDAAVAAQVAPFLLFGVVLAVAATRGLNALALGDDVARSLGQRVGAARGLGALAVVVCTGVAVAAAGPIGFVGLTVPHVARAICGPDYRWVMAWSLLLAPTLLLGADVIGRVVARPGELEVGVVSAFLGAPFFIALVRRRKLAEL